MSLPTMHTTNTRDEHPRPQRNSNPRSQKFKRPQTYASGHTATGFGLGKTYENKFDVILIVHRR